MDEQRDLPDRLLILIFLFKQTGIKVMKKLLLATSVAALGIFSSPAIAQYSSNMEDGILQLNDREHIYPSNAEELRWLYNPSSSSQDVRIEVDAPFTINNRRYDGQPAHIGIPARSRIEIKYEPKQMEYPMIIETNQINY